jgi:maltokinase
VMSDFHDQLSTYMSDRRWFAGKGRTFTVEHVHSLPWLSSEGIRVRVEVVTVEFEDGTRDTYQVPLAYLEYEDAEHAHAFVGSLEDPEIGKAWAYDAVWLKEAAAQVLEALRDERSLDGIRFRVQPGAELPEPSDLGFVMSAEQSNTSIAYGEAAIFKLFRRISAGGNPDIEIHAALSERGDEHIAPLLGWVEGSWVDADGERHDGHLGMLQVFLRTATDGWAMALGSVRDLLVEQDLHPDEVGGDFAAESERLGVATAHIHADLAAAFGIAEMSARQRQGIVLGMQSRLDAALRSIPELEEFEAGLRRRFDAFLDMDVPLRVQRIHGDFHLGQTLRTVKGWKVIDFEGEPAKSLAERVALDSPVRDVAGMVRSFDYAAGATLRQFGADDQLRYRSDEWAARNREAFLTGYAEEGDIDLDRLATVLAAYEADKAVYESVYETRNRPSWLGIPLHAVARIAGKE